MNRDILGFVTFCVGAIALKFNVSRTQVYARLKKADAIDGYIVPCYDVLHTFSRPYIVDDIIEYMKQKGVALP